MNYESAEITKISINLILASTITTSNILSELLEVNKANWRDVIPAVKLDKKLEDFLISILVGNKLRQYERYCHNN